MIIILSYFGTICDMPPRIRLVRLKNTHIYDQLLIEELLFRSSQDSWCILNSGPPSPTIVTGLSGKVPELVNIEAAKRASVPVIRRFTGGGTVVVDQDTMFATFILNAPEVDTKPYPRDIMIWSERFYKGVFNNLVNPKFSLRENDYVIGDLKIGGNAQAIAKNRFVHHTSFLWGFSPQCMEYLRMPKKTPDYRLERDHLQFLTELRSHYTSRKHVETNFMEQLALTFPEVVHVPLVSTGDGGVTPSFQEHIHSALAGRNLTDISRTVYVDLNEQV